MTLNADNLKRRNTIEPKRLEPAEPYKTNINLEP